MLRTVKLYGILRKKFGREFKFDIRSPAEAIQALCSQLKGFESFLRNAERQGLTFAVFENKKNLSDDEFVMEGDSEKEIRIAPIIIGSKSSGLFATILGVVMIVAGAFTFGMTSAAAVGMGLMSAGAGLALGGVAQMLAPSVKSTTTKEQDGNDASYAFGGAVTTTANGSPVGYLYGIREIGGTVVSGGVYSEDTM